jgi:hypothetical protein
MKRKHPSHNEGKWCDGCESRMTEAHQVLQAFFARFKILYPSMHVSWAYRGEEEQNAALEAGVSNAKFGESKHNVLPSLAIDIFEIKEGAAIWDPVFCLKVYKEALAAGFRLKNGGDFKVKKKGKWVSLGDYGHFEVMED